jgi:hypothetical protein
MKRNFKFIVLLLAGIIVCPVITTKAGNPDRTGQAGASELLINPWGRSSGWGSANSACVKGLEGMYSNIAGLAFTQKTELIFAHTIWLEGSGVNINSFGITQKVGESGVVGIAISSMNFGEMEITTVDLPEGGIGKFSPKYLNIGLSYSKMFSNSIYGGINLRIISESISDNSAQGIALDAGIQYVTGEKENIHFGIALKNVGPRLQFSGNGLTFKGYVGSSPNQMTLEQSSAEFELPSLLNIGAAYDIDITENHKVTIAGNFTSNSFIKDQFAIGLQYSLKTYLMLRGGYCYEKGISNALERSSALTGPSAGFTVEIPLNKEKGSSFGLDYSYRASNPFNGTHSIGARISL